MVTSLGKEIHGKRTAFTEQQRRDVIVHVARGLSYLHAVGVTHRDLKPDNVMQDEYGTWKLIDFGMVRPCRLLSLRLSLRLVLLDTHTRTHTHTHTRKRKRTSTPHTHRAHVPVRAHGTRTRTRTRTRLLSRTRTRTPKVIL